jgi:hypothetical protein
MAAGELWVPTSGTSLMFRDKNNVIRTIAASGTGPYAGSNRVLTIDAQGAIGFQASTNRLYWHTNTTDNLGLRVVAWRNPDLIGQGGTAWGPVGAIAVTQHLIYHVIEVAIQASPFRFAMYIGT